FQEYRDRLTKYDFSCITIKEYPIDIATEVFTRINTGGRTLTVFEIMVAKTYDEVRNFDLGEKFNLLRDGAPDSNETCLRGAQFDTVPETVVIQAVGALCGKKVRSKDILRLQRDTFRTSGNENSCISSLTLSKHARSTHLFFPQTWR